LPTKFPALFYAALGTSKNEIKPPDISDFTENLGFDPGKAKLPFMCGKK
jgi:hypothetical protein